MSMAQLEMDCRIMESSGQASQRILSPNDDVQSQAKQSQI